MLLHYFFSFMLNFFPIKLSCWFGCLIVWLFTCFSGSYVWINEQCAIFDFKSMGNSALKESVAEALNCTKVSECKS